MCVRASEPITICEHGERSREQQSRVIHNHSPPPVSFIDARLTRRYLSWNNGCAQSHLSSVTQNHIGAVAPRIRNAPYSLLIGQLMIYVDFACNITAAVISLNNIIANQYCLRKLLLFKTDNSICNMRIVAIFPLLCALVAFILSLLCIFAGSKTAYLEGANILTVSCAGTPSTFLNNTLMPRSSIRQCWASLLLTPPRVPAGSAPWRAV